MKIDDEVNHLSPDSRKPVFGASEKARLKPVSSATENRQISEILLEASLDMIPSSKRKIKALIRPRMPRLVCAIVVSKPRKTGFLTLRPTLIENARPVLFLNNLAGLQITVHY